MAALQELSFRFTVCFRKLVASWLLSETIDDTAQMGRKATIQPKLLFMMQIIDYSRRFKTFVVAPHLIVKKMIFLREVL